MRRDAGGHLLQVVENKLCIFETIVVDCGLIVVLRFAVYIGDASADYCEFDSRAGEIWVKLP